MKAAHKHFIYQRSEVHKVTLKALMNERLLAFSVKRRIVTELNYIYFLEVTK